MYEPYLPSASYDYHFQKPHDVFLDVPHAAYHLTLLSNLQNILADGLEPRVGPLSKLVHESEPYVYLFVDLMHLSYAQRLLGLRPGDSTLVRDDDPLVLLKVDLPIGQRLSSGGHFELRTGDPIPASAIAVLDLDYLRSNKVEFQVDYSKAQPVDSQELDEALSGIAGPSPRF